jgi:hypothetical protein
LLSGHVHLNIFGNNGQAFFAKPKISFDRSLKAAPKNSKMAHGTSWWKLNLAKASEQDCKGFQPKPSQGFTILSHEPQKFMASPN